MICLGELHLFHAPCTTSYTNHIPSNPTHHRAARGGDYTASQGPFSRATKQGELKSGFLFLPIGGRLKLQGVGQELVHLGETGRDAEVDGSVADLDDEPADDVRVDLEEAYVRGGTSLHRREGERVWGGDVQSWRP